MKTGYKQTPIGVLPDSWTVKSFDDLFSFANGVNADKSAYGRGTPFINVLEPITLSHIHGPEILGKVTLPATVVASYAVERGDVLFNRTSETESELGLAATYVGRDRVVFGGFVIRGRPKGEQFDPAYSGYALRAPVIRSQIVPLGQGAVRANIGQDNLGRVLAPVPPLPEQRAIAEALSDVDALRAALDRLIAKKCDLKQAAMQQLLTGRTRLPGFRDTWGKRIVREMGSVLTGKALAVNGPGEQRPYLRTKNVFDGRIDITDVLTMPMTDEQFAQFRIRRGDVLLNEGQSLDLVGRCAIYSNEYPEDCAIQNQLLRFRAREDVSADFACFLFRYCQQTGVFARIALQTTSIAHLGGSRFERLRLAWPETLPEQTAIAEVLSDMDAELAALEQRRDKTRALKQGMMQELLTGRTRLIKPGSSG